MAREVDHLRGQRHPQRDERRLRIEPVLAQALGIDAAAVPPLLALRDRIDALQVDAQRAAHVAQRRARPVADHDGGERGAVPAVLAVDVLDHLLAALVLEVDVDVGRLVALAADEAAEQQRRAARIDLGDVQAITHERVRRAAAALAQDLLVACPVHDVGHGEEVAFVVALADQRQFGLDLRAVGLRQPGGKALGRPGVHEFAQMTRRRGAGRHDLLRIFVAQFGQREGARGGPAHGVLQPVGRRAAQGRDARARTQVLLGIDLQLRTARRHRQAQPRGGERVLQGLARAHVHQHVARGEDGQTGVLGHASYRTAHVGIARAPQQLDRDAGAILEPGLEPHRVREDVAERLIRARHEQRQALGQSGQRGGVGGLAFQIARVGQVLAFRCAPARHADPVRQVAVAAARLRQQHEPRMRLAAHAEFGRHRRQLHLAADHHVQPVLAPRHMRAHRAGQRALVGDRERLVAQRLRALDQFVRMRRAGQKAEVAATVELGVVGELVGSRGMHDSGDERSGANGGGNASSGLRTAPPPSLSTWV